MSNDQPLARRTAYVVDSAGQASPATLTREDRLDAYRAGLARTRTVLASGGFVTLHACEHSIMMEFRGFLLDFRIQRPELVAHVTSAPKPSTGKTGSTRYKLSQEIKSEFCLQIIGGREASGKPLYVALDEDDLNPAATIERAVLGFLAALNERRRLLGQPPINSAEALSCAPETLPTWLLPPR